jgi:hypothetical protein
MIENKNPQEKLLTMLTEIYDQLEQLEEVLEYSLADLRGDLHQYQYTNMAIGEDKMTHLEHSFTNQMVVTQNNKENHQNIPQTLKLELGF